MSNKAITSGSKLANWLEDFAQFISGKIEENNTTVEAEIEPDKLQPVQWNNNTYYADFKESNAIIYDEGGELITTIQNANNIEDVEKMLATANIKVEKEETLVDNPEFQLELSKIMAYLNDNEAEKECEDENCEEIKIKETIASDNEQEQNEEIKIEETQNTENVEAEKVIDNSIIADVQEETETVEASTKLASFDIIKAGLDEMKKVLDSAKQLYSQKMYKSLLTTAEITFETLSEFVEQQYARENPGDIYNMDVQTIEQQKFENEAIETEQAIQEDALVDRTTVNGRYTVKNRITDRIQLKKSLKNKEDIVEETIVESPDNTIVTAKKSREDLRNEYQVNFRQLSGKDSIMMALKDYADEMYNNEDISGADMAQDIINTLKDFYKNPPEGFPKMKPNTLAKMVNRLMQLTRKEDIVQYVYNTILSYEGLGAIAEKTEEHTIVADLRIKNVKDCRKNK